MKITVIIPTFNSAKTIEAALDSVLRQTLRPTEILVVDDGSTDTTRSVLRRYDSEITLIGEEHKGVASARNVGCQRATGELVAFLDSDDLWHPNYLEVQSKRFAEYPDAKAFFTGHVDFAGPASCQWGAADSSLTAGETQLLSSLTFFKQYNQAAGHRSVIAVFPGTLCLRSANRRSVPAGRRTRICSSRWLCSGPSFTTLLSL